MTTSGDIDIELWSKEAPKACRNFVQLCLDGYYDNTIIHRIIKGELLLLLLLLVLLIASPPPTRQWPAYTMSL